MKRQLILLLVAYQLQLWALGAYTPDPCDNIYSYPPKCKGNCTYHLIWRHRPLNDSIEFIVSSRYTQRWTGVGFSRDGKLDGSDAVFAWIENGSSWAMMDADLRNYSRPQMDRQQSIYNITASKPGIISFKFLRKRDTRDDQDVAFTDSDCPYLIYPVEGGPVDLKNRMVITTKYAPLVSERPVCFRACNYTAPVIANTRPPVLSSSTTTTSPRPSTTSSTTTTSTTTTTTSTTTMPRPTTTAQPVTTSTTTTTTPEPSSSSSSTTTRPAEVSVTEDATNQQEWCVGRWSHPANCRFQSSEAVAYLQTPIDSTLNIRPLPLELSDCSYYAQWQYLEPTDSVEFIIQTKTRNKWTGIGFSNSTRMPNSDAIIGLIEEISGRHFVMDTWLRDHVMPEIDQHQNSEQTSGRRENGTTTVRFRRKRVTGDPSDFQFTDHTCAYFFFPTQGGNFNAISKRMHKHESVPSVSRNRICIRRCSGPPPANTVAAQPAPPSPPPVLAPETELANSGAAPSQPQQDSAASNPVGANLEPSSSSPAPSLSLSTSPAPAETPDSNKSPDATQNVNLAPANDLSAELDSSPTSPASASTGQAAGSAPTHTGPFGRLAFLSEPSLRWLAGIGCVATLLAMIVFQACFTVYRNKQAYKQNVYRQGAFKQSAAYLHGAYLAEAHQPSTTSDDTHTASLRNSAAGAKVAATSTQQQPAQVQQQQQVPPITRTRPQQPHSAPRLAYHHPQQPIGYLGGGGHVNRAHYDDFGPTPSASEASEQEEEEELEDMEEEEELDEEGLFDEELMLENSLDFGAHHHRPRHQHYHPNSRHPHAHAHHPHQHPHHHPAQHPAHHQANRHPHPHRQQPHYQHPHLSQRSSPHHQQRAPANQSHYRAPQQHPRAHYQPAGNHMNLRSQPHQQIRPDSYFLPSQRRY